MEGRKKERKKERKKKRKKEKREVFNHIVIVPVTANDRATRRKENDKTGSNFGLKNSSTEALNVCLNLPNPGTNMFARLTRYTRFTRYKGLLLLEGHEESYELKSI